MKKTLFYLIIAIIITACGSGNNSEDKKKFELSGIEKFDKKDFKGALADFDKHIALNPNDTSAYYYRAKTKSNLEDYRGSVIDNTKALELDPNFKKALFNRASNNTDKKSAIEDYTKLIGLKPEFLSKVFQNRGDLRFLINDTTGAMEDFKKSIEIQPKNPEIYVYMATMHLNSQTQLALKEVNKAFEFDSQYPSAFFVRGVINLVLKNNIEGCEDLQKAISLNYTPAFGYYEKYCKLAGDYNGDGAKQLNSYIRKDTIIEGLVFGMNQKKVIKILNQLKKDKKVKQFAPNPEGDLILAEYDIGVNDYIANGVMTLGFFKDELFLCQIKFYKKNNSVSFYTLSDDFLKLFEEKFGQYQNKHSSLASTRYEWITGNRKISIGDMKDPDAPYYFIEYRDTERFSKATKEQQENIDKKKPKL